MTCFWDGILQSLSNDDFQFAFKTNKSNNKILISLLKDNNKKTTRVMWNKKKLTEKQMDDNYEHVQNFNIESIYGGYLCSSCDPFLLLVSEVFNVNIDHDYCGNGIKYETSSARKTLRFKSSGGHFSCN